MRGRALRQALALTALAVFAASLSPAYYHFIRFQTRTAPFIPVYDKFELASLPGGAVPFFISEQGPTQLAQGDSYQAVVSQIRAAALAWNAVDTAEIKLAFGGLYAPGTQMSGPWIEVEFSDEIPPGIVALGGPVTRLDPVYGSSGTYVPIVKSLVRLPRNLTGRPSWSERFFLTIVHEFGHTLGLQHTWTSSVMSTEVTRATTKAKPLGADDIAGLSVLYPAKSFAEKMGSITGRVTMAGAGVNLASVVAISPNRAAVSALTNPDGTYRIDGLLPGPYFVYAHPLPPSLPGEVQPVNLELPSDPTGRLLPGASFDTVFYPGTPGPQLSVSVAAAQTADSIDFSVNRRASVNMYAVQTYSYFGSETVKPTTIVLGASRGTAVMAGYGVSGVTPGLNITVASAPETVAPGSMRPHPSDNRYLLVDFALTPFSGDGPRHLIFTQGNETYVLPSGMQIVPAQPPSITSVAGSPDRTLTVTGSGFNSSTQLWVDGVAAKIKSADDGKLVVSLPPAAPAYRGTIVALNSDGQSSLFTQGSNPAAYTFESGDIPQFTVTPPALPAGVETVIEINAAGMSLDEWAPRLGLGSSDVTVRHIWSTGPGKALAHVVSSASASPGFTTLSLASGLQLASASAGFQVLPASRSPYVAVSSLPSTVIYPGAMLNLPLGNFASPLPASSFSVTIGDRPALVLGYSLGQLSIQVPPGLPVGPAIVRVTAGGDNFLPAVIPIDLQPPMILTAQTIGGTPITTANPVRPGDTIQLLVSSLTDGSVPLDALKVKVTTPVNGNSGVEHALQSVTPHPTQAGIFVVQFSISAQSPASTALPLVVTADNRSSAAFQLSYRP